MKNKVNCWFSGVLRHGPAYLSEQPVSISKDFENIFVISLEKLVAPMWRKYDQN